MGVLSSLELMGIVSALDGNEEVFTQVTTSRLVSC
jgi:hypothetical protein